MAIIDNPVNLIATILLTFLPIIILFIPYLFTRRKDENIVAIIFNRAYIGFIVFYIAYFVFPSILNSFVPNPNQYMAHEYYPVPGTNNWSNQWDSEAIVRFGQIYIPLPLILKYLGQHFLNSVVQYLTYPVVILAFVFGISPMISIIILLYQTWNEKRDEVKPIKRLIKSNEDEIKLYQKQRRLVSEKEIEEIDRTINELQKENMELKNQLSETKSIIERLQDVQYEMEVSPFLEITNRVKIKNWDNEKELLKVLIAILPITLFLLMTILQILGETENPSILQGTSMGWFLEIFFAYIASIVFSVYLIKASRLSQKGKFLGDKFYIAMIQSLSTVGAFMSVLAIILFLIQYFDQIFVVSYFVVYFIMVSIFFVLFLDIFEPFSVYLLIKLVETLKNVKSALKRISIMNTVKSFVTGVIVGFLLAIGFLSFYVFIQSVFLNWNTVHYEAFFWGIQNSLSFLSAAALIFFIRRWNWSVVGTSITTYLSVSLVSFFIFQWYDANWFTLLGFASNSEFPSYGSYKTPLIPPFITLTSIFAGITEVTDLYWYTSTWKEGFFQDVQFIVPELRKIDVIWKGTGGTFLGILSIPYNILHPLAILMTYGAVFFLVNRNFHVKTEKAGEKIFFKSVYSDMSHLPSSNELLKKCDIILIGNKSIENPELKNRMDKAWLEIKDGEKLFIAINNKIQSVNDIMTTTGLKCKDIHRILDQITFDLEVPFNQVITLLHREFFYSYEEVKIDSLHIMMLDGRAVLSHTFGEESQVEPALVAGLFSAITSFAKEAVRSEQLLKTIDHGDVVLTIEYAKWVFAAIFADSTSTELRKKLSIFLADFEKKHSKVLPTWLGDLDRFYNDLENINDVFLT